MRRVGKIALWTVGGIVAAAVLVFAGLQTGIAKRWLVDVANRALAAPGSATQIGAIDGLVPFDMTVSRVELDDRDGAWLTIDRAALKWSPSALLTGRLRVDLLSADTIAILRQPASSQSANTTGFSLPRLPLAIDLRDLDVRRLIVSPQIAGGDNAEAAIHASGVLARSRAELAVDISRTDGQPGRGTITAHLDQASNALSLKVDVDEPTGILMDALTGRADHLPLRMTLDGGGPLSGWVGKLKIVAGPDIGAEIAISVAQGHGSRVGVSGIARFSPLLAENARPLIGDRVAFDIAMSDDGKGGVTLAPSSLTLASVKLEAQGAKAPNGALSGTAHIGVPDASQAQSLIGRPTGGSISIDATLSGTFERPKLALKEQGQIVVGDLVAEGLSISADIQTVSRASDPDPNFDLAVDAKVQNLRNQVTGPASYGPLTLHFAGAADAQGKHVDVRELTASGAGIDLKGGGSFKEDVATGKATLAAGDMSVLGGIFGLSTAGAASFDIDASAAPDRTVTVRLDGTGDRLSTGIPAADALLAGQVRIAAAGTAVPGGKVTLSSLSLASTRFKIDGSGDFDPASRAVQGSLTGSLADLGALSKALSSPLTGAGTLSAKIGGTLDAPAIEAEANFDRVRIQSVRIDHFDAKIAAPQGLNGPATAQARLRSDRLDERIDLALAREGEAYRLTRLSLAGTGGTVTGAAVFEPSSRRVFGKISGAIGDLSVWSAVIGQTLAGGIELAADVPAGGRQGTVKLTAEHLALGRGPDSIGLTHAALVGRIAGDLVHPNGTVDLMAEGFSGTGGALTDADAHVSVKGDKSDFRIHAAGRFQDPVAFDLAGSVVQGRGGTTLQANTLAIVTGKDKLALIRPATLSVAPGSYRLTGLALAVDSGQIAGDAALSPRQVSANIKLDRIPLHPLAQLAGKHFVAGTASGSVTLSGTSANPTAHVALATESLDLQTDGALPRPKLDFSADIAWRGERANLDMKLASGNDNLTIAGAAPFAFDLANFQPRRARDQSVAIKVAGGGRLENLVSIVPLGEDRVAGAFTVDASVGGTLESPRPAGRVTISDGHYANMALGTELDGIDLALNGVGERFVLDHLTATDGKGGKLNASGAVDVSAPPVRLDVSLGFKDFLVARSDDTTVQADGDLKLAGTLADMKVTGSIKVDHGEIYIPERLPASVVTLDVSEIGGSRTAEAAPEAEPLAPIGIAIALDAPGQVFIRGRGIESEWRGHIDIGGTTAGPQMNGQLSVINGTISLLGQTFSIDKGVVAFGGGASIDPLLDIQASVAASGVTAQVAVSGTARAPKIALSSVPQLPQDEILARVLFGSSVGTLTPSQGLQLAAAAATLAQGGPGVLDRVRSKIGLDRLDIGSGGSNPNGTQGAAKGTTVTGGKYIANGVFVGVTQGISGDSQAKVEVEITPGFSVNSTFGASSGSGFGGKYSIDY
jgi:translocation and assembly module TamB